MILFGESVGLLESRLMGDRDRYSRAGTGATVGLGRVEIPVKGLLGAF